MGIVSIEAYVTLVFAYIMLACSAMYSLRRQEKMLYQKWELEAALSQVRKYLKKDLALKCDKDEAEKELIENIDEVLDNEHS